MKRAPKASEGSLVHVTAETGHRQVIALSDECFDRDAIARLRAELPCVPAMPGWFIAWRAWPGELRFTVRVNGLDVARNEAWDLRTGIGGIELLTNLMPAARYLTLRELMVLADLEECAAIALFIQGENEGKRSVF